MLLAKFIVSLGLVLLGIVQLALGFSYTRHIIRELPSARRSWQVLGFLIIGFVFGYSAFALFVITQPAAPLSPVIAFVFAAGGTFVVMVTRLSTKAIEEVRRVTSLEQENARILAMRQRLQTVLDNVGEGIFTFSTEGVIESFNRAAERLFGYAETEIVGKQIDALLVAPDALDNREGYLSHFLRTELRRLMGHEGELVGRHRDGSRFPLALKVSAAELDGRRLHTALVADISERKAMLERLRQMAERDSLTGVYNRRYFQQELERAVQRSRRARKFCLLYIDLDNFKYVNDTLGHAAGDRLLVDLSQLLAKRVRQVDLLARFGGDEFTVLLNDTSAEEGLLVAESFRSLFSNFVFHFDGHHVDIGCSIGVAAVAHAAADAKQVLAQADFACHLAKRAGRNCVHLFDPADQSDVDILAIDMGWSRRIKKALEQDRFVLAFQPILTTRDGSVECYEVLLRMLDEHDKLIMPVGFLPAAERFGLAGEIDRWVVSKAIDSLASKRAVLPVVRYAINLSAQTLSDDAFCDVVVHKLNTTGVDPAALTFEVTETTAIANMMVAEQLLGRLREIGCRTALDDFGSGMSSFAYLRDLPVDLVKIDGHFVKRMATNVIDQKLVKAMNDIVQALGKRTVAEFVEDAESLTLLTEFGVDYAQGYHLGRPELKLPRESASSTA